MVNMVQEKCILLFILISRCWFVAAGLDKIEFLQNHENLDIYQKVFDIIEHYFSTDEEDNRIAPKIDENSQQYEFNAGEEAPSGGFQF